jgi:hypothetical protein
LLFKEKGLRCMASKFALAMRNGMKRWSVAAFALICLLCIAAAVFAHMLAHPAQFDCNLPAEKNYMYTAEIPAIWALHFRMLRLRINPV